ncbi:MAG: hypothetical protein SGJ19_17660 [Planctomycetia bacterium]|nr:hypothetical protein [Planctomycetia bacterium]
MDLKWHSISPKSPHYHIATAHADIGGLLIAFDSMWKQFISEVLPHERSSIWDHIRCDMWIDEGSVAVTVADCARPMRRTAGGVKILMPMIREKVDELTENLDDDAFEVWLTDKMEFVASQMIASLERCRREIPWELVTAPGPLHVSFFAPEDNDPFAEHEIERPI